MALAFCIFLHNGNYDALIICAIYFCLRYYYFLITQNKIKSWKRENKYRSTLSLLLYYHSAFIASDHVSQQHVQALLVNACFQTAPDIQSPVMSCLSAIDLVLVTTENKSHFQPESILSKQSIVKMLYIFIIKLFVSVDLYFIFGIYA